MELAGEQRPELAGVAGTGSTRQSCADEGRSREGEPGQACAAAAAAAAAATSGPEKTAEAPTGLPGAGVGQGEAQKASKSFIPDSTRTYLGISYWEERFAEEEEYEWCKDYSCFRDILRRHVGAQDRVLVLGCGNSRLSEAMWRDGLRSIVSTDLSQTVIARMNQRCQGVPDVRGIRWQVADMLALPFADASFDVVVEKGALDVFFVDNESAWDPSPQVRQRVHTALAEAHRVLTPKGTLLSISFGQPHFRKPLFETGDFTWAMQYHTFGDSFHYFFYHLRKVRAELWFPITTRRLDDMALFLRVWYVVGQGSKGTLQPPEEDNADPPHKFELEHEFMDEENFLMSSCNLGMEDDEPVASSSCQCSQQDDAIGL